MFGCRIHVCIDFIVCPCPSESKSCRSSTRRRSSSLWCPNAAYYALRSVIWFSVIGMSIRRGHLLAADLSGHVHFRTSLANVASLSLTMTGSRQAGDLASRLLPGFWRLAVRVVGARRAVFSNREAMFVVASRPFFGFDSQTTRSMLILPRSCLDRQR